MQIQVTRIQLFCLFSKKLRFVYYWQIAVKFCWRKEIQKFCLDRKKFEYVNVVIILDWSVHLITIVYIRIVPSRWSASVLWNHMPTSTSKNLSRSRSRSTFYNMKVLDYFEFLFSFNFSKFLIHLHTNKNWVEKPVVLIDFQVVSRFGLKAQMFAFFFWSVFKKTTTKVDYFHLCLEYQNQTNSPNRKYLPNKIIQRLKNRKKLVRKS